jgi:D-aminopeptidase
VTEAVEEAVYNAMLQAVDITGHEGRRLEAIPPAEVERIVRHHRLERG